MVDLESSRPFGQRPDPAMPLREQPCLVFVSHMPMGSYKILLTVCLAKGGEGRGRGAGGGDSCYHIPTEHNISNGELLGHRDLGHSSEVMECCRFLLLFCRSASRCARSGARGRAGVDLSVGGVEKSVGLGRGIRWLRG